MHRTDSGIGCKEREVGWMWGDVFVVTKQICVQVNLSCLLGCHRKKKKVLSPKIQWHLFQLLWANINGNFSVIPLHLVCTSFIANAALHCQYLFACFSQGYVFMGTKMLSTQQMLNKCLLEECTVFSGMNTHKCQVTASLSEHLKSLVLYLIIFLAFQETRF